MLRSGVLSSIAEARGDAKLPDMLTLSDFKSWSKEAAGGNDQPQCTDMVHACTVLKVSPCRADTAHVADSGSRCLQQWRPAPCTYTGQRPGMLPVLTAMYACTPQCDWPWLPRFAAGGLHEPAKLLALSSFHMAHAVYRCEAAGLGLQ